MADLHRVKDFIQRTMGAIKKAQDAGDQEGVLRNTAFLDRAIPLAERSVAQAKAQPQPGMAGPAGEQGVPLPAPQEQERKWADPMPFDPTKLSQPLTQQIVPNKVDALPAGVAPKPFSILPQTAPVMPPAAAPAPAGGGNKPLQYLGQGTIMGDAANPETALPGNIVDKLVGGPIFGGAAMRGVLQANKKPTAPKSPDAPASVAPALPAGAPDTVASGQDMAGKLLQGVAAEVETDVEAEAIKRISKELGDSKGQNIGELIVTLLLMGAPRAFSMAMQRKSEYQRGVKAIYDKIRAEIEHRKDRDANAGFRGRELASTEARTAVMKQNADARPEMGENRDLQSAARAIISNPSIPEDSQQKQWAYRMIGAPVLPAQPK